MITFLQALWISIKDSSSNEDNSTTDYSIQRKRLAALHRSHLFDNSKIMPSVFRKCNCDEDGVSYWRDHDSSATFDCCPLHRSRKQMMLEMQPETDQSHQVLLKTVREEYNQRTQDKIRERALFQAQMTGAPNGNQPRRFMSGDADSLCFQLSLIEERLKRMILRKELAIIEEWHPRAIARPVNTPPSYGPIDIWYELAEDKATPPVMLNWLTNHRNPYIASRAVKTLRQTKKSA